MVMIAMCFASNQPNTGPENLLWHIPAALQNLLHVPAYAVLAASWCLILPRWREWRVSALIVLLCVAFGALDEWHQSFIPGRQADLHDLVRDAMGATFGLGIVRWMWAPTATSAADNG